MFLFFTNRRSRWLRYVSEKHDALCTGESRDIPRKPVWRSKILERIFAFLQPTALFYAVFRESTDCRTPRRAPSHAANSVRGGQMWQTRRNHCQKKKKKIDVTMYSPGTRCLLPPPPPKTPLVRRCRWPGGRWGYDVLRGRPITPECRRRVSRFARSPAALVGGWRRAA